MKKSTIEYIKENWVELLLSIPKTIYFNFRVLPLRKAFKLPFIVSYHVKLRGVNKKTLIYNSKNFKFASSRIGLGSSRFSARENKKGLINIQNGQIEIKSEVGLSQGIILDAVNAKIKFGKHFRCNYSTTISAVEDDIVFGDDVVLGWKVNIRNHDGHSIIEEELEKPNHGKICIGNNTWICAEVSILKSTNLGNDCVVAYGSLLSKTEYTEDRVLYAGVPAKIIKRNISWKE